MNNQEKLSLAIFAILNEDIGSEKEIQIRRGALDIQSCFFAALAGPMLSYVSIIISGSKREGFRIPGSDFDVMTPFKPNIIRLFENDQSRYNSSRFSANPISIWPLYMELECEESNPGFYKLRIPFCKSSSDDGFIVMQGKTYFRSDWNYLFLLGRIHLGGLQHGPCLQSTLSGDEVDLGICIQCPFWPKRANPWIKRCSKWPNQNVVQRIIKGGCHVMAIGSQDPDLRNIEWRISFSMAELELIYSMNHTQFLVYGLLKLFLKEVLDKFCEESMLCSYFMKTAVLWEIQENPFPWDPCTIVSCFWLCFKRLISWVERGFCPNFFIPENNMFYGKIFGCKQEWLLCQLLRLYEEGITCIFQMPSFNFSRILKTLYPVWLFEDESRLQLKQTFEIRTFNEIKGFETFGLLHTMIKRPMYCLRMLEDIVKYHHTEERKVTIQHFASLTFHRLSFCLYNSSMKTENKFFYKSNKLILSLLTLAEKYGNVSEILYLCIFLYRTQRYEKAASLLEDLNRKLNNPSLLYNNNVNIQKYEDTVGNEALCEKLRKAVAFDILLDNESCYIKELLLEQQIHALNDKCCIIVPALVFVHMLQVLVNNELHNEHGKINALENLFYLVHYNNGLFIPDKLRDISWHILGICQLVCGEFKNAMQSFMECFQILKQVNGLYVTQTPFGALHLRIKYIKDKCELNFL
ncbi:uncharacterized protein LOC134265143 [Saccostrea cucullata]|uniref:uncharacterized protein LOC134265143 n=1 Tax=Saccostrea cuccullata TaxID=36930 RepID=UPI002ED677DC